MVESVVPGLDILEWSIAAGQLVVTLAANKSVNLSGDVFSVTVAAEEDDVVDPNETIFFDIADKPAEYVETSTAVVGQVIGTDREDHDDFLVTIKENPPTEPPPTEPPNSGRFSYSISYIAIEYTDDAGSSQYLKFAPPANTQNVSYVLALVKYVEVNYGVVAHTLVHTGGANEITLVKGKNFYSVASEGAIIPVPDIGDFPEAGRSGQVGLDYTDPPVLVAPVALDLDGDLRVSYQGTGEGAAFDFGHGLVATAWVSAGDGLLVYDYNADGCISGGEEFVFIMWGSSPNVTTDMQALAAYFDADSNGVKDGILDVNDSSWSYFGVWQDLNFDGVQDDGEFSYLADWGIASINLSYNADSTSYASADGDVLVFGQLAVTLADGSTMLAEDVAFAISAPDQPESSLVSTSVDSNQDGALSLDDSAFSTFGVWHDQNSFGIADATELSSLQDSHINDIDLTGDDLTTTTTETCLHLDCSAEVTYADGSTTIAQDITFAALLDQALADPALLSNVDPEPFAGAAAPADTADLTDLVDAFVASEPITEVSPVQDLLADDTTVAIDDPSQQTDGSESLSDPLLADALSDDATDLPAPDPGHSVHTSL